MTSGSIYTEHQYQCCDDASDTSLIENIGVAPEWGCNQIWSNSIVINEISITIVITALTLTLNVDGSSRYFDSNPSEHFKVTNFYEHFTNSLQKNYVK